jgi:hypothetical protein
MSIVRRALWAGVAGLAIAFGSAAQEKKEPDPAPASGEQVTAGFRAYVVAEPRFPKEDIRHRVGKMQDLVTDHALEPTIAIFSRTIPADANHPLAALVKKVDELQENKAYKARRLGSFLVFLSLRDEFRKDETRDARLMEIERFVSGLMPKHTTVGLAEATETPDGTNTPLVPAQVQAMGVAPEDDIVVVFYNRFHVLNRWKFAGDKPPTDADLKAIEAAVAKALAPKK